MTMSTTICKNDTFSCFFSTIHIFLSYNVSRAWSQTTIYLPIKFINYSYYVVFNIFFTVLLYFYSCNIKPGEPGFKT